MLRILVWMAIATIALFALQAAAQDTWPSRPVKLVVPFPASGPLDVMARLIGQKLGENLGRPMVIENIAGATGSIGANAVARAAPDGYTILLTVDLPLVMFPAVADKLPYDPRADFRPVASLATGENGLFVNAALGAATVAELVAIAKAQPGKLAFSSAGIGSPAHFAGELFKRAAGVEMIHVPYKGAAPAMSAALSGEVGLMFGPITQGMPHVKSGKLRVLAVTGAVSSPLLPSVKPLIEQGFPGLIVSNRYPVMLPASTPDAVASAVTAAFKAVMDDAAIRGRLEAIGLTPSWENAAELARAIDADLRRWSELARIAGITAPR